jgi:hypothetical protein
MARDYPVLVIDDEYLGQRVWKIEDVEGDSFTLPYDGKDMPGVMAFLSQHGCVGVTEAKMAEIRRIRNEVK